MTLTEDISNGREQLLDEVLARYLHAAQEGRAPTRRALLDSYPELASDLAEFFADQDHVERLAAPLRAITPPQPAPSPGATLGDYELLGEIAHGGMGVVYRARQKSLQRIVALKVLQAGPLASPEQWQRFQAEAEAIASLDHPNIVPVYAVGVHDNLPYFSMKLFEGGSLAQRFSASGYRPSVREAAALLATIADAVAYAHQHGILHRDLKPANILLDERGQPHVSDFGLAKRASGSGETRVEARATPTPIELTLSGAILGTPSYMAPEQAAGSRVLTTAADIYGLGAILYELLTGRPPFRGDNLYETLRRLQEEEPAAPRSLQPQVDRDLETICLKCLDKEPARRYTSAAELSRELRRYLAGEPISARPISRIERVWRWCRRKPIATAVIAAFAVLIVLAFLAREQQRRRAEANATEKELANRSLAARSEKGRRLIEVFCRRLSEDGWGEEPVIQGKRKRLLEDMLAYYRDFLDDPDAEAPARNELIHTYYRIGDITAALGERQKARDAFDRGRIAAETVLQLRQDDRDARFGLARILNRLGTLDRADHQAEDALRRFKQARELLAAARAEAPDDTNLTGELGVSCNNLGNLYSDQNRLDEAAACYKECIDLNRDLARHSGDLQWTYGQAVSLENYALLVYRRGQREEAWERLHEAEKLIRSVVAAQPNVPRYQQQLGRNLLNQGGKLWIEKRYAESVKTLTEGRTILEPLVKLQPGIWWFKEDLALLLDQLARSQRDLGTTKQSQSDLENAIKTFQAAGQVNQQLSARNPRSAELLHKVARCSFQAGLLQGQLNQKKEAIRSYEETRNICRRLVKDIPNRVEYQNLLGLSLNNLGRELWQLKRMDEARTALREALPPNRFALERSPQSRYHRRVLNTTCVYLGDVYRDSGQREEWTELLRQRRELWPDNPGELVLIAADLARAKAEDEAMRTLEQAVRTGFTDVQRLEKDSALNPLRQRPDYRKLLQELRSRHKVS